MRKYINSFIREEDGMETIEFIVILATVSGLIAVISAVGVTVRKKADEANTEITNQLDQITYGSGKKTA